MIILQNIYHNNTFNGDAHHVPNVSHKMTAQSMTNRQTSINIGRMIYSDKKV